LYASDAKAVVVLRFKGVAISVEEENALYIAILLHDIGHGPFSHAMEKSIVEDVHHEEISLLFMHQILNLMDSWICRFKSLKGLSSSIYVATHF
jgi:HD superfamily phosphohydrolase